MLRQTWAEIDLGAVAHNIGTIKEHIGPQTKLMAVIKADAYGHGAVPVAKTAIAQGVEYLGVAIAEEAIELREAGIMIPVLVLGTSIPNYGEEELIRLNIAQGICDLDLAQALNRAAARVGKRAVVHLKVDTGMGRLGILPESGVAFVEELQKLPHIEMEGIYTHFAASDAADKSYTEEQFARFRCLVDQLAARGIKPPLQHVANSAALVELPHMSLNMVRPGIMLFGVYPGIAGKEIVVIRPTMSLKSRIVHWKKVEAGTILSYGLTYATAEATTIATVPIGYADGYRRHLSNKAYALVNGARVPQVGRICMDQCLFDVGKVPGVKCGDEVVLIGSQGDDEITLTELADLAGTIPHELAVGLTKRVPRVYRK